MESQPDLELHSVATGSGGPPIALLHGLNESLVGYRPSVRLLESHLRVFALDFRGHGESPWRTPYRVPDYAADTLAFLETRIEEPAILAGHSLGGLVAAFLAARHPGSVLGLILEDPPLYTAQMPVLQETHFHSLFVGARRFLHEHQAAGGSSAQMEEAVAEWRAGSGDAAPTLLKLFGREYVSRLAYELHRTDPRTLDPVLDGTLFDGFVPDLDLAQIACPVHLIAGGYERGGAMRESDIARVAALIPTCSHRVWSDLGHDFHTIRPQAYAREVLAFVDSLLPS